MLDGRRLTLLELGTGWMHFYGLSMALIANAHVDLQDVWDNRQFHRLQSVFARVPEMLPSFGLTDQEMDRAAILLAKIASANSMNEIYSAMDASYIIDQAGNLGFLEPDKYDAIFSMDVLEHVHAESIEALIANMFRALKPGGYALHQIGHDDHLTHYDRKASKKQFLRYGEMEWNLRFANAVQYFNRIGHDDMRGMFLAAGFKEVSSYLEVNEKHLAGIKVAKRFRSESRESLAFSRSDVVYQKPEAP